jgi:integrase
MARKPGFVNGRITLKYWESLGGYFVNVNGRRECLAKGPDSESLRREAEVKLHGILAHRDVLKAGDRQPCEAIFQEYGAWVARHRKPATVESRDYYLQRAIDEFGHVLVSQMNAQYVERMILRHEAGYLDSAGRPQRWGPASRRACVSTLHAAFAWAVRQGLITKNPLAGLERPPGRSRGRDALLREEDHQKLLEAAPPWTRDLLIALNDTGARPGAVYAVEAHHLQDLGGGVFAWVGTEVKRERHEFAPVIYLTPRLVEMHHRLAALHPTGPIFRNRYGKPWRDSTVAEWFKGQRERLGLGPCVCPYSYRHKFATEWLLAGKPIAYLAELQNTSVRMIEHHYGHLREHGPQLHQSLLEFRGGAIPEGGSPTGRTPPLLRRRGRRLPGDVRLDRLGRGLAAAAVLELDELAAVHEVVDVPDAARH